MTHRKTGWIAAGGDAGNDYAGEFHGLHMSYGRKSGSGGGNHLGVGARIFQLNMLSKE